MTIERETQETLDVTTDQADIENDTGADADIEIPADLQAAGIVDPNVYVEMKKAGISNAKELGLFMNGRNAGYAMAHDRLAKEKPQSKPDPEPEPVKPEKAEGDPVGVLAEEMARALGVDVAELEEAVDTGKLDKRHFFKNALNKAAKRIYRQTLSDGVRISQRLIDSEIGNLAGLVDDMKARNFFDTHPQYQEFAKGIKRQVDAGYPLDEVLQEYDAILAQRGSGNGKRQPTEEDIRTAQLMKARVSVEGHTETPGPRGNPASGQLHGKAEISKAIDDIVEARKAARSGDPKAEQRYKALMTRWQRTRSA